MIENIASTEHDIIEEPIENIRVIQLIVQKHLEPLDRDIIILSFDFHKSEREIAKMLRMKSHRTIAYRKQRALKQIAYIYTDMINSQKQELVIKRSKYDKVHYKAIKESNDFDEFEKVVERSRQHINKRSNEGSKN